MTPSLKPVQTPILAPVLTRGVSKIPQGGPQRRRTLILGMSKNENTRPGDSPDGCYVMLVAGTGFEPVTFRL